MAETLPVHSEVLQFKRVPQGLPITYIASGEAKRASLTMEDTHMGTPSGTYNYYSVCYLVTMRTFCLCLVAR